MTGSPPPQLSLHDFAVLGRYAGGAPAPCTPPLQARAVFFVGKEAKQADVDAAAGDLEVLYAYPGEADCLWIGWSPDKPSELDDPGVRIALLMTLHTELRLDRADIGTRVKIPDITVRTVLDSITGKGPMWWSKKGHKFVRQSVQKAKGFA